MLMSFFLSVFISASVGTPGSMYELDVNGKYSDLNDLDVTARLHRSASLPVAGAKVDGNTTDNGDGAQITYPYWVKSLMLCQAELTRRVLFSRLEV